MKRDLSSFLAFYLLLIICLISCQHLANTTDGNSIVIEGKIYLMGNEPFTELAIQTQGGKVFTLRGDLVTKLKDFQGQWVELKGKIIKDQTFLYSSQGFFVEEYKLKSEGAPE